MIYDDILNVLMILFFIFIFMIFIFVLIIEILTFKKLKYTNKLLKKEYESNRKILQDNFNDYDSIDLKLIKSE